MANPKTTIAGYLVILGAIATAVGTYMLNGSLDIHGVMQALALAGIGAGLVAAKDGGH
jgi:hypothetical protein